MECAHAHLIKDVNIELGGTESTIYSCEQCREMFTVTKFKGASPVYGTT